MNSNKIQITEKLIKEFADFSGDKNPIHLDESFANRTIFKKRIAHGTIILARISQLLTEKYGDGNIIITEEIKFLKPAYINDLITLNLKDLKSDKKNINKVQVLAINQKEEIILECTAECTKVYIKNDN